MKKAIREQFLHSRKSVSIERREEVKLSLIEKLIKLTAGYKNILSFYPLSDEVDISPFNKILEEEDRLSLPKILDESLIPYAVTDMEKQLKTFSHRFLEPKENLRINDDIDLVLVPGIAFDREGGRIGFGKGITISF